MILVRIIIICKHRYLSDEIETTEIIEESVILFQEVERLNMFIDRYKSVLMKQPNAPIDPAGYPYHFNNTWMPWLPDDYQSISEMHFTE